MQGLKPIYSDDPDALTDARDLLVADSRTAIPERLKKHPPLAADLRAQAATGKSRPCRRAVALKVVFIDESGRGHGRLGELLMEQIADATATGELYPAISMAGVCIDAPWDGALTAAFWYARECRFGIAPGTDVRWSVRVLQRGENWDEHTPCPLGAGQTITGRSAGLAFFLGLFALGQADGAPGVWEARKVVERMVALATLPDTEARAAVDPLGTLGGEETRKLAALAALPAGTRVVVVFPSAYTGSVYGRHESLAVTTVAELVEALRHQCAGATKPDSLPVTRRAARYIGGSDEVRQLTQALRAGGMHVVSGSAGVGKTARVVEAAEPLWQAGVFPGGRFWIDLYCARETGRTSDVAAAEAVATTCGERPAEKLDDLRAQTRRLLAKQPGIVLLEGAETVAEGDIATLLDLFPMHTTVVWMTRRETDVQHSCLRSAAHHLVRALSPADALELLFDAAGRNIEEMSATERADWEEIANATERLPLLLGWAGAALQPDRLTTAAQYLAELRADTLGEIADPDARERRNAGRFLRRSLARIAPLADMPDLPAVAERLFAGLAAFDPSHGAPLAWWPLAAGLDATTKSEGRRRLAAARRALLGLGLVTAGASPPRAGATGETLHAVHALAGVVGADLWRGQPAEQRRTALSALCQAATAALETPLPPEWFHDAGWVAGRTAEAAHFGHWLGEMEAFASEADLADLFPEGQGITVDSSPDGALCSAWIAFLLQEACNQPLLALKDTAWMAVRRHCQQGAAAHPGDLDFLCGLGEAWERLREVCRMRQDLAGAEVASNEALAIRKKLGEAHPDASDFQRDLSESWDSLGDLCNVRQDRAGAEVAFTEAMAIRKKLAEAHPDVLEFQLGLSEAWDHLGDVREARQDWAGAEDSFTEAMAIRKKLAEAHPDVMELQHALSVSWHRLGNLRRHDWTGAEVAFNEALAIRKKLAEAHPDVPLILRNLSSSWDDRGDVSKLRQDWAGAEVAFTEAMAIRKKLAEAHPDVPDFQNDLSFSWDHLGDVQKAREDWAGAEAAFTEAMAIRKKLAEAHPDVPVFQGNLSTSWDHLGKVREARQDWAGAEESFTEAMAIRKKLAGVHPDVPAFQEALSQSWDYLGEVHKAREDWAGAEVAFNEAKAIRKKLADVHPDIPDFQLGLAASWDSLGMVHEARLDFADADIAFNEALAISKKLAEAHSDMPDFQCAVACRWELLATVAEKRGEDAGAEQALRESLRVSEYLTSRWAGVPFFEETVMYGMCRLVKLLRRGNRAEEAAVLARSGLVRAKRLASLLQETGAELTEGQEQTIARLTELAEPETGTVG